MTYNRTTKCLKAFFSLNKEKVLCCSSVCHLQMPLLTICTFHSNTLKNVKKATPFNKKTMREGRGASRRHRRSRRRLTPL